MYDAIACMWIEVWDKQVGNFVYDAYRTWNVTTLLEDAFSEFAGPKGTNENIIKNETFSQWDLLLEVCPSASMQTFFLVKIFITKCREQQDK